MHLGHPISISAILMTVACQATHEASALRSSSSASSYEFGASKFLDVVGEEARPSFATAGARSISCASSTEKIARFTNMLQVDAVSLKKFNIKTPGSDGFAQGFGLMINDAVTGNVALDLQGTAVSAVYVPTAVVKNGDFNNNDTIHKIGMNVVLGPAKPEAVK